MTDSYDLHFYFDPVCPFAWMTSKWVRLVQAERAYRVDWRFISLRLLNAHIDYDAHFPPEYEAGHMMYIDEPSMKRLRADRAEAAIRWPQDAERPPPLRDARLRHQVQQRAAAGCHSRPERGYRLRQRDRHRPRRQRIPG